MNWCRALFFLAWLSGTLASVAAAAPPSGFTPLPEQRSTLRMENRSVTISYKPAFKLELRERYAELRIFAEGDLRNVQSTLVDILSGQKKNEECGERIRVHSISIRPSANSALINGTIRFQQWHCIKTKVPEFRGLKINFKNRIVSKTMLIQQSADICARAVPVANGPTVRIDIEVTCARPHGALGKIVQVFGFEGELKTLARRELAKALARRPLIFAFPEELRQFEFEFVGSPTFVGLPGGHLGVEGHLKARISQEQVPSLVQFLQSRRGR